MDLVSIIVPVYNLDGVLAKCLDSILSQTYKNIEVIIVDDGSTDDSVALAKTYVRKDPRVKLYEKENAGVSSARNVGIGKAKGEYITFVDGDDYIDSAMIEVMCTQYQSDPEIDVVICSYICETPMQGGSMLTEGKSEIYGREEAAEQLFWRNSYQGFCVNKLFKRQIISENQLFFEQKIRVCEDQLFCCQYFGYVRKAAYCHQKFYHYVMHEGTATASDRYNPKRYDMFEAYVQMEKVINCFYTKRVRDAWNNQLGTTCVLLAKMSLKYNRKRMKLVAREVKKVGWKYLRSDWQLKFRIAFIPLKIWSLFC